MLHETANLRTNHFTVRSYRLKQKPLHPMPQQWVSVFSQESRGQETITDLNSLQEMCLGQTISNDQKKKKKQSMRQTTNDRQTRDHTYRKPLGVRLWSAGSNKRNVATQKMAQQMWPFAPSTIGERRTLRTSFWPTTSFSGVKSHSVVRTASAFATFQRGSGSFPKCCATA